MALDTRLGCFREGELDTQVSLLTLIKYFAKPTNLISVIGDKVQEAMDAAMVVTTDLYPATSNPFIRLLPPRLSSRLVDGIQLYSRRR